MPVFEKDSEVFDAVSSLQAAVERLNKKTGLDEEDRKAAEAEKKAAEEAEKKAAEEAEAAAAEAKKGEEEQPGSETAKVATTPPEPPKAEEKPSGRGSR